ncbi:hypothetical protein TNCV_4901801 [Trichonephila clavipes]|nr:hypothetical protein TNCV_4901801 [Trichonephila clavipes]
MEEEAEKYYIKKRIKRNESHRNTVTKLQQHRVTEVYHLPGGRAPQFEKHCHRQQYGRWNWRNDQSQHPDTITDSIYNVYSPQFPSPTYHHPSFSHQRPTLYPRNQRFQQRPTVL